VGAHRNPNLPHSNSRNTNWWPVLDLRVACFGQYPK
jgi:hypothetical protein